MARAFVMFAAAGVALLVVACPVARAADAPAAPDAPEEPVARLAGAGLPKESPVVPAWTWERAWSKIQAGGYTMIALAFLSVMGVAFFLERLFNLNRRTIAPQGLAERVRALCQEGNLQGVEDLARSSKSTLGRIVLAVLRHRKAAVTDVYARAEDIGGREIRRQFQKAYPLAVVATLSPLLGLMGTIFGMMDSFEVVAVMGSLGDASILADGISKALVTTATGLIIAVPTLAFYHFFRSRTNKISIALEEQVSEVIDALTRKEGRP